MLRPAGRDAQNAVVKGDARLNDPEVHRAKRIAQRREPAVQCLNSPFIREENGGVDRFEKPSGQVDKLQQPVDVVAVQMGEKDALDRVRGDPAGNQLIHRHHAHIDKIAVFPAFDHCAGTVAVRFRDTVAGAKKDETHEIQAPFG